MDQLQDEHRTKLRRIILLSEERAAHEWDAILLQYAVEVTHMSLRSHAAMDLLALPAACLVVDGRSSDQFGMEYAVGGNSQYFPPRPVLWLTDDDAEAIQALSNGTNGPVVVRPYRPETVQAEFVTFMASVLKVDLNDPANFEAPLGQHLSRRLNVLDMICEDPARVDELRAMRFDHVAFVVGMMSGGDAEAARRRLYELADRVASNPVRT